MIESYHYSRIVSRANSREPNRTKPSQTEPSRAEPSRAQPSRAGPGSVGRVSVPVYLCWPRGLSTAAVALAVLIGPPLSPQPPSDVRSTPPSEAPRPVHCQRPSPGPAAGNFDPVEDHFFTQVVEFKVDLLKSRLCGHGNVGQKYQTQYFFQCVISYDGVYHHLHHLPSPLDTLERN